MQVKSIAECSKGSILQYFRPSLSYHLSLSHLFYLFLSGHVGNPFGNPVFCPQCSTNYDDIVDHCIHDCLSLNLRFWYAIQQLRSDVCTYLRSLDDGISWPR